MDTHANRASASASASSDRAAHIVRNKSRGSFLTITTSYINNERGVSIKVVRLRERRSYLSPPNLPRVRSTFVSSFLLVYETDICARLPL